MTSTVLPCPFCGHVHPEDDQDDAIFPTGAWREVDYGGGHVYTTFVTYHEREPSDGLVWIVRCVECSGGCGAEVRGLSKQDAIEKWNRRADPKSQNITK